MNSTTPPASSGSTEAPTDSPLPALVPEPLSPEEVQQAQEAQDAQEAQVAQEAQEAQEAQVAEDAEADQTRRDLRDAAVADNTAATNAALDNATNDAEETLPRAPRANPRAMLLLVVTLMVLYTCYLARDLIVPVLLAVFLALCGNPVVSGLRRLWIPRWIGALLMVMGGLTALAMSGSMLLPPAAEWMRQVPNELRQHVPKLRELTKPFEDASKATQSLETLTQVGPPQPAPVRVIEPQRRNLMTLLADAPRTLASILAVLILTFFFMAYGEDLLRRFVSVVPGWHQKRVTVDILRSIQADISRYMLTITVINILLGAATGLALYWIGLDLQDAMLWGVVIGILNYAPYLGPLVGVIALTVVGMVEFDTLRWALLPPAAMLALHVVESQFVTPLVLGARMAISPVILMIWLFLWGWMWGIAGLLLAVPMLVAFKIYCSRVDAMRGWAAIMEPYERAEPGEEDAAGKAPAKA